MSGQRAIDELLYAAFQRGRWRARVEAGDRSGEHGADRWRRAARDDSGRDRDDSGRDRDDSGRDRDDSGRDAPATRTAG